ncbi:hypothetical protein OG393_14730 [Streptomyces sp. NBC_01216]|uniref:hypothetical protein n=1 Tax=Streptomyces sp. NBC_01216 TaxID=2903778 RepID=UPI002E0D8CAC|nr:hypothetical protein OG393_14730 [Streptomyces sp. NBC_01216]
MNGDPLYHWLLPALSTVLVLPVPVAVLAGWTPPWMRHRRAGLRLRAYAVLNIYAFLLLSGVPRITDASFRTVMSCATVGFGFLAAAVVLFLLADRRDTRARTFALSRPGRTEEPTPPPGPPRAGEGPGSPGPWSAKTR